VSLTVCQKTPPTAAPLALEIADSDVESPNAGKTHKRPFDEFIFDVFAESDDEANTTDEAAVGRQKRSRCGDIVINDITDDDNVDDEPTQPSSSSARPTACSTSPAGETNAWSLATTCLPEPR
jgi:hypothetical protein